LEEIRKRLLAFPQGRFGLLALTNLHPQPLIDTSQFLGPLGDALFQFVVSAAQRHLVLLALADVEVYPEKARGLTTFAAHHGCRRGQPPHVAIHSRRETEFRLEIASGLNRVPDLLPQSLSILQVNALEKLIVGE